MHREVLLGRERRTIADRVAQPHVRVPRREAVGVALRDAARLGHERDDRAGGDRPAGPAARPGRSAARSRCGPRRRAWRATARPRARRRARRSARSPRSPRGRYPSSSGVPTGAPAARRDASDATSGHGVAHPGDVRGRRHDVGGAFAREHARRVGGHRGHDRGAARVRARAPARRTRSRTGPSRTTDRRRRRRHPPRRSSASSVARQSASCSAKRSSPHATVRSTWSPAASSALPGPLRALEPHRLMVRGLLAAEPGEELVEVVDDRHAGTAVHAPSPVSDAAPEEVDHRHRAARVAVAPADDPIGRPCGHELVLVAGAHEAVRLGDVVGQPAVRLAHERRRRDPPRLERADREHRVGVGVARRERRADRAGRAELGGQRRRGLGPLPLLSRRCRGSRARGSSRRTGASRPCAFASVRTSARSW